LERLGARKRGGGINRERERERERERGSRESFKKFSFKPSVLYQPPAALYFLHKNAKRNDKNNNK
jgi:hypothetical protein